MGTIGRSRQEGQLTTVVALYLSPEVNLRLRPKLRRELRPGSRVVSHDFDMGDWLPERTIEVPQTARLHRVFLRRIPHSSPGSFYNPAPIESGRSDATDQRPLPALG